MELTQEQKIDFGQCFNLACELLEVDLDYLQSHKESVENNIIDFSVSLYYIKQKAKKELSKIEKGNLRIKDITKENQEN